MKPRPIFHIAILIIVLLQLSCAKDSNNPYAAFSEERLTRHYMLKRDIIQDFVRPVRCTDKEEWKVGKKLDACGEVYFPYHRSVDEKELHMMIEDFHRLMAVYRPLLAPYIICTPPQKAKAVVCKDGKAAVEYEHISFRH